jgi:hypothetical protein
MAINSGDFAAFERVPMASKKKLVNPLCAAGCDLQGFDPCQFVEPAAPRLNSAQGAGEMIELYWMALARDVPFAQWDTDPTIAAAVADLNRYTALPQPRAGGSVTPATVFRETTPGDLTGPYISQFLLGDWTAGASPRSNAVKAPVAGQAFLTDFASWLAIQNGANPVPKLQLSAGTRRIITPRDLTEAVHNDAVYQFGYDAALMLASAGVPLNPGNPYLASKSQVGFTTGAAPQAQTLLGEVTSRALKAQWYQKWLVHRRLRPEAFGGLIHNQATGKANYPVSGDLFESPALGRTNSAYGTFLLPQAYPEGSPLHPSYASGHATILGATVTILKAFYDGNYVIPNPVIPNADGSALMPYSGPALTVGGELDKLAGNVATGRNWAGIHYRSDAHEAVRLGEAVAINLLKEQKATLREPFTWSFTSFDGGKVTI